MMQQMERMLPVLIDFNNGYEEDENFARFSKGYMDLLHIMIYSTLSYYWENIEKYSVKESNVIKGLLSTPEALEWVNQYRLHFEEANHIIEADVNSTPKLLPMGNVEQDEPFVMRESFFSKGKKALNTQENEHFAVQGIQFVQPKAAPIYQGLINWLADQKYIANSNVVKKTLAYRLTGYGRPDHLEPIQWFAKDSYELVFLVKTLPIKTDYKKMKEFFFGPEWLKEKDSSYAYLADKEFKEQLSQTYQALKNLPQVFPK